MMKKVNSQSEIDIIDSNISDVIIIVYKIRDRVPELLWGRRRIKTHSENIFFNITD